MANQEITLKITKSDILNQTYSSYISLKKAQKTETDKEFRKSFQRICVAAREFATKHYAPAIAALKKIVGEINVTYQVKETWEEKQIKNFRDGASVFHINLILGTSYGNVGELKMNVPVSEIQKEIDEAINLLEKLENFDRELRDANKIDHRQMITREAIKESAEGAKLLEYIDGITKRAIDAELKKLTNG